eukprot:COSAG02_NODE_17804_length_980_cov_0.877412_2_plen_91_part_01
MSSQDVTKRRHTVTASLPYSANKIMKWHLGCDEHNSAPAQVKACIDVHKDIAFRSKDPEGVKCHEFLDVMGQLLVKLGVGAATSPTPLGGH